MSRGRSRERGRGGSGDFTPRSLSGLALWLDAADQQSITSASGLVSQWDDKSGNSRHATATTTQRPTTGTRTQNGRNALDFNGSTNTMLVASGAYAIPNGPNTLFCVYRQDTFAAQARPIYGANGTPRWGFDLLTTPTLTFASGSSNVNAATRAFTHDTALRIAFGRRSGTSQTVSRDGLNPTTNTNAADVTLTSLAISSATQYVDGLICEIVAFTRSLSNTEANLVGNYLAAKWGGSWTNL